MNAASNQDALEAVRPPRIVSSEERIDFNSSKSVSRSQCMKAFLSSIPHSELTVAVESLARTKEKIEIRIQLDWFEQKSSAF